MFTVKRAKTMVVVSGVMFFTMLVVNMLANLLPLNGITTGAVSDSYPNLFAPIGLTFAVWGVIYLLTGGYQVIQLLRWNRISDDEPSRREFRINIAFSISSFLNAVWIFFWHFRLVAISMAIILGMLVSLAYISMTLKGHPSFPKVAFGVYFGWITIATVANITAFLVSLGVPNTTVGASLQTMAVLLIASALGAFTTLIQKDLGYGIVVLWALSGIYLKHVDPLFFDRGYPMIFNSAIAGFVLVLLAVAVVGFLEIQNLRRSKKTL